MAGTGGFPCRRDSPSSAVTSFRLEGEEHLEFGAWRAAAIHGAQVEAGGHFAEFIAYVVPDPGHAVVVHDYGGPAIKPTKAVIDACPNRPDAAPLIDECPVG